MNKPPAPSGPHDFAKRVAGLERVMQTQYPTINNEIIADLLACIREQQAALTRCVSVLEAEEAKHTHRVGMKVTLDCSDNARAVLAKYALEVPK